MSELRALRERVEKADTTDPIALGQIANEIAEAFYGPNYTQEHWSEWASPLASIDAAVTLIERKLPGRDYTISVRRVHPYMGEYPFEFTIWGADKYHKTDGASAGVHKHSICLAAIAALLNALENVPALRREPRP